MLRTYKKWIFVVIGFLLALLILKIVLFLTAKPKITVDYAAEYNKTTRPKNYDPNDNAAPYYQKAFDAFVDMPDELWSPYIDCWPTDFNDIEQDLLEEWLISNTPAFEYLREALSKPYYWAYFWMAGKSEKDKTVDGMMVFDFVKLYKLTKAFIWDAKLKATKGQFQSAFENIIGCYKAGKHKCRPNLLLTEQHIGFSIKREDVDGAMVILDRSKVESEDLKFLQDNLKQELDRDTYIPGSQAEKLYQYDKLQRAFIDNGKGTGRLWWRVAYDLVIPIAGESEIYEHKVMLSCFTGPTRNRLAEQIEQTSALFNQVMTKTPWQIKNEGRDYFGEIESINNCYFSLKILGIGIIDPKSTFHTYHKTRAQAEALIAILAILRYKADTGQLPESLDKLVAIGYLQRLPNDPYNDGPLVYKFAEDNFKLYSVGKDFSDDGGAVKLDLDDVYWPFEDLMKLRYGYAYEQAKRLRGEKEAGTQRR